MCTVCGCGPAPHVAPASVSAAGEMNAGREHVHAHAPGTSAARIVEVETRILEHNDRHARANRAWLKARGVLALNLMSSPGSGKTTLLTRTIRDGAGGRDLSVIEGDQQTTHDADAVRAAGARAVQINTGKGCHLDAYRVGRAMAALEPAAGGLLFIENVGNLVCPAGFDLGEQRRVVILSVTEGEDKPLKYPDMFAAADLMIVNKTDLLQHVAFDLDTCIAHARRVNPDIDVLCVSATSGVGMSAWYSWIHSAHPRVATQTTG